MLADIKAQAEAMDLENRDPNGLNAHLGQVAFEEIFGEVDSVHSMDCVWKNSFKCFTFWKTFCYTVLTFCCGLCIAMEWGCYFAGIAFNYVWIYTPCLKAMEMEVYCFQKFFGFCVNCCLEPVCETCGKMFSAFQK